MIDINLTLARFHGIIVCVLGSKQGPPTTPLHTGIVTIAVVPFVMFAKLIVSYKETITS